MIIGHQKIWKFLKKSFELKRLAHAYLFSGPEKIGKKTLALEFIKLLNCENKDNSKKPCQVYPVGSRRISYGACRSCQDIQKRQHPDFTLIEPRNKDDSLLSVPGHPSLRSGWEPIQISQLRKLSWRLSLKPYSAPFKTAIIDRAHLMTKDAQSCFLKTLEEPKGNAILILISECPEMLLPTILSRVQKLRFLPVKKAEIENYLKQKEIGLQPARHPQAASYLSEKEVKEIVEISLGKPGVAIDFVSAPERLENQKKVIKELIKISNSDLVSRFQYAKDLSREPQNLKETLDIWLNYFRNILIEGRDNLPQRYSVIKLKNILKLIQSTNFLISTTNVNPRLTLEILMLEL